MVILEQSLTDHNQIIGRDADRCVLCGLCLPHCPTYQLAKDEGESPRGRISLMLGLSRGQLALTPTLVAHFDHCLGCRACENVCPSGVPYGRLIDRVQNLIVDRQPRKQLWFRLLSAMARQNPGFRMAFALIRISQQLGILFLLRRLFSRIKCQQLIRLLDYLPVLSSVSWATYYPPQMPVIGEVGLFTGCIARQLDQATIRSAITVLTTLGYGVHLPTAQTCCGALHRHGGYPSEAKAMLNANTKAFSQCGVDTVVTLATGCGVEFSDPASRDYDDSVASIQFVDINRFLAESPVFRARQFRPMQTRVCVHIPCSQRFVLHEQRYPVEVLRRIPQLEVSVGAWDHCCGAAGSYMLIQADIADALRKGVLDSIDSTQPDILATSNIGCALHLAAGLKDLGRAIEVLHPVSVVARCLTDTPID